MSPGSVPIRADTPRCRRCGTALADPSDCPRCAAPPTAPPPHARRPDPWAGLAATFEGLRFVGRNPRLGVWIALPLLVNLLLFAGLVWWTASTLGAWVPEFGEPWPGWIDWLREGLRALGVTTLLRVLAALVGVLAAFLVTLLLAAIVNAPFYDVLSEQVENVWFGRPDPGRGWLALPGDTVRALGAAISLALRQVLVLGVLFLLSFVIVGAPLFALAGFYFAGLGLADVPLGRKLYPAGMRARWARRRLLTTIALGVPVSLVPPLAPFGIVGATLLYLRDPDKP